MIGLERAGFRGYRAKAISAVSKQSSGKYLRGCIKVREIIGSKASINLDLSGICIWLNGSCKKVVSCSFLIESNRGLASLLSWDSKRASSKHFSLLFNEWNVSDTSQYASVGMERARFLWTYFGFAYYLI